jgi:O-antigen ligase
MNKLNEKNIKWTLIASLIVSVPSLILLATSNVTLMSKYFTIVFTILFLQIVFTKQPIYLAAFTFTLFPLINFLKGGFYFYNISTVLLILIYLIILIKTPHLLDILTRNKAYRLMFVFLLSYYTISFFLTHKYNSNLRSIDMILSAGLIPLLFSNKKLFKSAFMQMGVLAIFFAIIIGYFGGRYLNEDLLGETEIGGGNPISYGIPVSLFLAMILFAPDYILTKLINHKWKLIYWILVLISCIALIVTTSRGSILAFLFCFIVVLLYKKSILATSKYLLLIAFGLFAYSIASSIFPEFKAAEEFIVGRAQNEDIDLNRYSHNRAIMWDMVMNEVNIGNYVVFGSGPGSQQDEFGQIAYRQRQSSNFNMNYAFHALPLQLIVEIGIILTLIFYLVLMLGFVQKIRIMKGTFFILPILGIVFWLAISLSVSGLDMLSGMAFGFFFLNNKTHITINNVMT